MSQYQSTSVTVVATPSNAELIEAVLAEHLGSPMRYVPSGDLMRVRDRLAALPSDASMRSAIGEMSDDAGARLDGDLRAFCEIRGLDLTGGRLRAVDELTAATRDAERLATGQLLDRALVHIGFHVRRADGTQLTALEARRGHSVVLVGVARGGSVELDTAGHGGDDCEALVTEIRRACAREGLQVEVRRRVRHGDANGGSLIQQSARASRTGDLVEGLLMASLECDAPVVDSIDGSTGVPTRRRQRGGN